jgi:signal transduction histidine kinase
VTAEAEAGGRFRIPPVPLFAQVLSLALLCLVAALAIILIIIFQLPPPAPDVYGEAEIAQALRGKPAPVHEGGPPLVIARVSAPPKAPPWPPPRSVRTLVQTLSHDLEIQPQDLVIVAEPPRWGFDRHIARISRERFQRNGGSMLAPFKVARRLPDGHWLVVEPRQSWPNQWQQRMLLWFVVSALAVSPLAYLFSRRLAAPIVAFAAAADRLGRDPGAPPLQLKGPKEIATAVVAFNDMQERLRRYVQDRTAMVGAIAHDLRTPLTRLRFRVESAPESLRAKMAADIDQMEAMIAATLAFVRDATETARHQRLELVSLVQSVADEMAETGLDVVAEPSPQVVIEGDPIGLRRLVTNLLDNAVKFGTRAKTRVYAEDGCAMIEVDDDGPGIPSNERERVFEPFHRGEPSRSRETGGAGLGLAVVRSIARAHGGDVVLENRPEGGLRARARLPL